MTKIYNKTRKNKKVKIKRKRSCSKRRRPRKTRKIRIRKLKGRGPVFSRVAPGPLVVDVVINVSPHWIKKADVRDDICALCLESLRNVGRKYVVYALPCGHQFHAYCLSELCVSSSNTNNVALNNGGLIPCPTCRTLFSPDEHCYDVDGFSNSNTEFMPQPIMRMLESHDYTFDENYGTSEK